MTCVCWCRTTGPAGTRVRPGTSPCRYLDGAEPMWSAMAWQQPGPSARQIGQSAHCLAAGRTGTCGSWTLAETRYSPGATWTSTRSAFSSCTGASNAHVSTMPTPSARPPGSCLMLPMRTSRQRWPMSWPEVTGTPGPSRPGPCGTGRLPPPGEPRQRHWHLAYRRDASAMTPGPMPPSQTIRRACRVNPMRVPIIWACRAGTVTNSSGIRGPASCPATSPIERSVPRRRCYPPGPAARRPNREASNRVGANAQSSPPGPDPWVTWPASIRYSLPAPKLPPRLLPGTTAIWRLTTPPSRTARRQACRLEKGHRDFPVGGQLISLRVDRLCPCGRSADLLVVRSAVSLPSLRWPRRAAGFCLGWNSRCAWCSSRKRAGSGDLGACSRGTRTSIGIAGRTGGRVRGIRAGISMQGTGVVRRRGGRL